MRMQKEAEVLGFHLNRILGAGQSKIQRPTCSSRAAPATNSTASAPLSLSTRRTLWCDGLRVYSDSPSTSRPRTPGNSPNRSRSPTFDRVHNKGKRVEWSPPPAASEDHMSGTQGVMSFAPQRIASGTCQCRLTHAHACDSLSANLMLRGGSVLWHKHTA